MVSGSPQHTPIRAPGTRAGAPWPHPSLPLDCVPLPRCGHKGDARHPPGPARSGLWGPPLLLGCGPSSELRATSGIRARSRRRVSAAPHPARSRPLFPARPPAGAHSRRGKEGGGAERHKDAGRGGSAQLPRSAPCCQPAPRRAAPLRQRRRGGSPPAPADDPQPPR